MQNVSRNICVKSFKYKKCLREKNIANNPNFFEVGQILSDYVERNNKKFDFYLVNCEIKLDLNKNLIPYIKREYFYNTNIFSMKGYFVYWIDYFMSRGHNFCKINEMIIQTISNRRDMTYKHYINQPMSMCERKINLNIATNPHLINSLHPTKIIVLSEEILIYHLIPNKCI